MVVEVLRVALADREGKCSAGAGHCADWLGSSAYPWISRNRYGTSREAQASSRRSDGSLIGMEDHSSKESPDEMGLHPGEAAGPLTSHMQS